jgi:hypothetical protein
MNPLRTSVVISLWCLVAALSGSCVGKEGPSLSSTTVVPPPSLAVDACPLAVSEEQVTVVVPAAGGARTFDVITGATCTWTAESRAAFVSITSEPTGKGSATVTVTVQPNTGAQRSGTIVINQLTVTLSQAAAPCEFGLTSTHQSFDVDGGAGTVGVVARLGADCQWAASSSASFVTITSGSSGTGNGSVTFRVAPNLTGAARSATLAIAGVSFTVNQAAPVPDVPDTFSLSVGGYQQPWCNSPFTIRSSPGPDFPPPNVPGSFTYPTRQVVKGTVVQLSGSAGGSIIEWSDCDDESGSTCRVTMDRNQAPRASISQSCATPAFSAVSRTGVSASWEITFTAVNLLPYAGMSFGGVIFTVSCPGFSDSLTLPSQASGRVSGSILVSMGDCSNGGSLSLSDFNGSASTSW